MRLEKFFRGELYQHGKQQVESGRLLKKATMGSDRKISDELARLALLSDAYIDLSDAPEQHGFVAAERGKYLPLKNRNYDVRAIANWCIAKANRENQKLTNMSLNKLVYFIVEKALTTKSVILTQAKIEAWNHGPVFREIYFESKGEVGQNGIEKYDTTLRKKIRADEDFLNEDIQIFEEVWKALGHKSAAYLRNLSHKGGSPWDAVWNYSGKTNPGMEIDVGIILSRFSGQMNE